MPDLPLAGCHIVLTRPADQTEPLAALIRAQGGEPISFPLLAISPLQDYVAFEHVTQDIASYHWAIFISMNAVNYGIPLVLKKTSWPAHVKCAGIGPTTAAALESMGITGALTPKQRFDSEGLLALPEMQAMTGKRIIIFRGQGGRELIADTLRIRGAEVSYAECYYRRNPQQDAGDLPRLWQNGQLQAIVVTSSEALRNLLELAGNGKQLANWLRATPLYVSHPRIGEQAHTYGLQAHTAKGPGDEAMLQCLLDSVKPANREQSP